MYVVSQYANPFRHTAADRLTHLDTAVVEQVAHGIASAVRSLARPEIDGATP